MQIRSLPLLPVISVVLSLPQTAQPDTSTHVELGQSAFVMQHSPALAPPAQDFALHDPAEHEPELELQTTSQHCFVVPIVQVWPSASAC
jgi:hypothetical protein